MAAGAETARDLVERYHDAWARKDFESARGFLHDDLSFTGPIDTFDTADEYLAALQRLAPMTTGIDVKKVVSEGDDVVVLFDLLTPMGAAPVAEWYRVRGDRIGSVQVYFDARPFAQQP
jgi:ketosteroid isomerase-like protein